MAELARLSHHFLDVVAGLPTLRTFGRAKAQAKTVGEVTDAYRRATLGTLRLAFLSALVLELLATFSVALVAVAIGLRLEGGHLGLRTGLLVLVLAPEAYLPLRQLAVHYRASADGLAAAADVFDVLETPPDAAGAQAARPAGRVKRTRGRARLRGGTGAGRGRAGVPPGRSQPAPAGADFAFGAGEVVALTGPSGSGKSTLIGVLLGFITQDAGSVVIEEAVGERRLDQLDLRAWRARVAWCAGPGAAARNGGIEHRLGWPGAPRAAVKRAARRAALHKVELGPPVGEGGSGLSAGQKRRVAVPAPC